jgi:hypothetical protein
MNSTCFVFVAVFSVVAAWCDVVRDADAVKLEPNSTLRFEFPELPDTLETMKSGKREPARLTARLPANYSRDGKFPLCVFLNGGGGGRGDSLQFDHRVVGSNDFICVTLPLFKRAPLDTNSSISMPDFPTISRAYQTMLGKLLEAVPNTTPERSALGGFSNGAHTTAVLLAGQDEFILQHFRAFYFIEGGFGLLAANFLSSPTMKPYRFLVLRGDRAPQQPKNVAHFHAVDHLAQSLQYTAQQQELDFTLIVMRGLGHELRQPYDMLIGSWLRREKLPEIEK